MSIELFIYLANLAGNLQEVLIVATLLGSAAYGFAALHHSIEYRSLDKLAKWPVIALTCGVLIAVAIPSEKTIWLMAGAHVTKEALETDTGKKVIELINAELDKALKEVTK